MRGAPAFLQQAPPLVLLLANTAVHILALGLFSSGFLLTRVEVNTRSSCCEPFGFGGACGGSSGSPEDGCWGRRHYNKSVWIVIDALRFDFVACEPAAPKGCQSRMPQLLELTQTSVHSPPRRPH